MKLQFTRNLKAVLAGRESARHTGALLCLFLICPFLALGVVFGLAGWLVSTGAADPLMVALANSKPIDAVLANIDGNSFPREFRAASPSADLRPGTVYGILANESRLEESHYQQPLVDYVAGSRDAQGTQAALDELFPAVTTGRRFEYKKGTTAEAVLSESDDIRAIGADFKRVEYTGESVQQSTKNKGLMIRLDKDNYPIAGAMGDPASARYNTAQTVAARLTARLLLNDLRRGLTALLAVDGTGTAKTWNASGTPDADVVALIDSAGDLGGNQPNTVVFGNGAWTKRFLAATATTAPGQGSLALLTPDQLANLYQVDRVHVSKQRYSTAKSDSAKTKALGAYVIATYIAPMPMLDDPSAVKRFVSPTDQGGLVGVHVIESAKFIDVIVEHYSQIDAIVTTGTKRLNIS